MCGPVNGSDRTCVKVGNVFERERERARAVTCDFTGGVLVRHIGSRAVGHDFCDS